MDRMMIALIIATLSSAGISIAADGQREPQEDQKEQKAISMRSSKNKSSGKNNSRKVFKENRSQIRSTATAGSAARTKAETGPAAAGARAAKIRTGPEPTATTGSATTAATGA